MLELYEFELESYFHMYKVCQLIEGTNHLQIKFKLTWKQIWLVQDFPYWGAGGSLPTRQKFAHILHLENLSHNQIFIFPPVNSNFQVITQ